ncbi:copper-binding protein [Ralstonia mannitolilytica]|uniref:copper-binding protein n=1 Tax=Ralstonia mannitolilytica TaxID=105219 RepID=UPI003B83B816
MKAIQVLSTITFAALSASAFAGPNWDAINSARKAAQQQRVASAGDASDQAMRDHCAMMGQMSATGDKMHEQMMHQSDGQLSNANAALFGERAATSANSRTVGAIDNLGMGAMTMTFSVKDKASLKNFREGQAVWAVFDTVDGQPTVVDLRSK